MSEKPSKIVSYIIMGTLISMAMAFAMLLLTSCTNPMLWKNLIHGEAEVLEQMVDDVSGHPSAAAMDLYVY